MIFHFRLALPPALYSIFQNFKSKYVQEGGVTYKKILLYLPM